MTIKYIWFDLGYTLVYLKREKSLQVVLSGMNKYKELKEIEMAYHLTDKFFMREHKGLLCKSKEEFMPFYLKKLFEFLDVSVNHSQYLNMFLNPKDIKSQEEKLWHAYDNATKVLLTLKRNSIKVGLISNWDNTSKEVLKQNNLYDLLDDIVVSDEIGYAKPDKEIFEYALRKAKVKPNECLFVGDNYYDDVVGSSKVNMKAVLINPYGKIGIEELDYDPVISNLSELPKFIEQNYHIKLKKEMY